MMKVASAPTYGQWLGPTSGRSLGKAKLGSRDIFGVTSQRVFGSPRNSNYRTGKYSAGLFPSASVFENRRVLDLLLFVPPTAALAALSNSSNREREELALFAYGGSTTQIAIRY